MTTFMRKVRVTDLGDTIATQLTFTDGALMQEDICIEGPPELIGAPRGSGSMGKDIYRHEARPERDIWHVPGRNP